MKRREKSQQKTSGLSLRQFDCLTNNAAAGRLSRHLGLGSNSQHCSGSEAAICPFIEDKLTSGRQFPVFEKNCLQADAKQSQRDCRHITHFDPACVKTSFKSELGPNLLDFRKFQFAKALISLKPKFE